MIILIAMSICSVLIVLPHYERQHACNNLMLRINGYSLATLQYMNRRESDLYWLQKLSGVDKIDHATMQQKLATFPSIYVIVCDVAKKEIKVTPSDEMGVYEIVGTHIETLDRMQLWEHVIQFHELSDMSWQVIAGREVLPPQDIQ
jgi:hypothetical protein